MHASSSSRPTTLRVVALGAALVALLVAVYANALDGEFLWDDDSHVSANPVIIGPFGLREIWTTGAANYFPLVLTNFWIQHALWGLNPVGYHSVTLAFHVLGALLLWRVLGQLRVPGAWVGAALWAVHPVQVESVAWICELKNTQSGVFFLLAISFFVRWVESTPASAKAPRFSAAYVFALVSAVLAILSKPSTVMLPVILVLCWWWLRRDVRLRSMFWVAPFFLLSALASAWTIWEQKVRSGASGAEWDFTLAERFLIAGRAVWFYLGKLFWPEPLVFIYPRWVINGAQPLAYLPVIALVAALWLLWRNRTGRSAGVLFAAGFFVVMLFPILGFFNVYFFRYSFVGDHFQYLASMGPMAAIGAALMLAGPWVRRFAPPLLLSVSALLAWRHSQEFRDNETLWRATLAKNPNSPMPWVNLGVEQMQQGDTPGAVASFERALQLDPRSDDAFNNLGLIALEAGEFEMALAHFRNAVAVRPLSHEAHSNLSFALRRAGQLEEAIHHGQIAVNAPRDFGDPSEAHNHLASALTDSGRPAEAVPHFETALRFRPKDAEIHHNLANALRALGRLPEAIARYQRALALNPELAETHNELGVTYSAAGNLEDAERHFRRAIELRPEFAEAHTLLGGVIAQSGRIADALPQLQEAVRLAPDLPLAQLNLGKAYSALGRWPDALAAFRHAAELAPESAEARGKLGLALANTGALAEALKEFQAALRLEPKSAEVHTYLGQTLRLLGREAEAAAHLAEAAALQQGQR